MSPLAITLAGIGVFTVICAGFTVAVGAVDQLVVTVRRRYGDPLRPDRDREQLRRALARTARH